MTEDDSPFDDLDADEFRDREGDPFEHLDSGPDGEQPDDPDGAGSGSGETVDTTDSEDVSTEANRRAGSSEREASEPDPFEYLGASGVGDSTPDSRGVSDETDRNDDGERDAGSPPDVEVAGDPLGDVDVSRGDPFESANNPFERVDVEGVDPDEVWERFAAEAESVDGGESAEAGGDRVAEDDIVDVPKHRFCETCPHFSAPPAVDCGHPGTEILEFVGTDEIRVSNCPVVRERRELGEVHE